MVTYYTYFNVLNSDGSFVQMRLPTDAFKKIEERKTVYKSSLVIQKRNGQYTVRPLTLLEKLVDRLKSFVRWLLLKELL